MLAVPKQVEQYYLATELTFLWNYGKVTKICTEWVSCTSCDIRDRGGGIILNGFNCFFFYNGKKSNDKCLISIKMSLFLETVMASRAYFRKIKRLGINFFVSTQMKLIKSNFWLGGIQPPSALLDCPSALLSNKGALLFKQRALFGK